MTSTVFNASGLPPKGARVRVNGLTVEGRILPGVIGEVLGYGFRGQPWVRIYEDDAGRGHRVAHDYDLGLVRLTEIGQ